MYDACLMFRIKTMTSSFLVYPIYYTDDDDDDATAMLANKSCAN